MCSSYTLEELRLWNSTQWDTLLRREQDQLMRTAGKIALIGQSGAGKSSAANSLRELADTDHDAAPVTVFESINEICIYSHPRSRMVKFWDLPGVGTRGYPKEAYLDKIKIDQYDFFLLLSASKFTEADIWLAKEIAKRNKPYYYVRTKVSIDIANERRIRPGCSDDDVLNKIRAIIRSGLAALDETNVKVEIFLVDNHETDKYDFQKLMDKLTDAFPSIQISSLMNSLRASNTTMIKDKVKELRSQVWKTALLHAAAGGLPLPGLGFGISFFFDAVALDKQFNFYVDELGLDESSLKTFSQLSGCDMKILQGTVDAVASMFTGYCLTTLARNIPREASKHAMKDLMKLGVPVVGWVAAATASYVVTWWLLNNMLDRLEDATLKVLEIALQARQQSTASA